eukprot:Lithocolla_globosa_v1_NODE_815_length_3238_cov_6.308200.p3 type:complete len:107 gc:universal NODE_815_length_3238_cov_6.308200:2697-3017(+)
METHVGKDGSLVGGVSKRVDLPTIPRNHPKMLPNPCVTLAQLVDRTRVGWASVIGHSPPANNELNLLGLDEMVHCISGTLWSAYIIPPTREKGNLNNDELSVRRLL